MHIDNIMADYRRAKDSGSRDAAAFPLSEGVFREVADRVIERKTRLVDALGLDLHGRMLIEDTRSIKDALNDLDPWSETVARYAEMLREIRCWVYNDDDDESARGGKERENLLRWTFVTIEGVDARKRQLLADFGDENTLMYTDACGRRVRMGKALSKAGVPNAVWERRLSMVIEDVRNAATRKVVLSVNPLDMYLMSSDTGGAYTSCHSPTGLRQGGPWQYMADTISLVAMTIATNAGADSFPYAKDGRAMVYVPDENSVVVGRGYGRMQRNYTMAKIITARLTAVLGGTWVAKNDLVYPYTKQNRTAAYHDSETLRVSIRDLVRGSELVENHLPYLDFADPICAECGSDYTRENGDYDNKRECDDCTPGYDCSCSECGENMHSDEDRVRSFNGNTYCEDCYDRYYFRCDRCDETYHNDDANSVTNRRGYEETWCDDCRNDRAFECHGCSELHHSDREVEVVMFRQGRGAAITSNSESFCPACASSCDTCPQCDTKVESGSIGTPPLVPLHGRDDQACHSCVADMQADGEVVQYERQYFTPEAMVQFRIDEYVDAVLADERAFAQTGAMA